MTRSAPANLISADKIEFMDKLKIRVGMQPINFHSQPQASLNKRKRYRRISCDNRDRSLTYFCAAHGKKYANQKPNYSQLFKV